jgi:hypothetical protein
MMKLDVVYLFRFDPWSLLQLFKRKAASLGAEYVTGELVNFGFKKSNPVVQEKYERNIDHAIVSTFPLFDPITLLSPDLVKPAN